MMEAIGLTPLWGMSFALTGRLLDLGSTWWVTPDLKLEGNPLVKRMGWKVTTAYSLLFPILGYITPAAGIMLGSVSSVMAFSNLHIALITRHTPDGANTLRQLNAQAMHNAGAGKVLLESLMLLVPVLALGTMMLLSTGNDTGNPGTYVGYGLLVWCGAVGWLRMVNLYRFKRALRNLENKLQTM